MANDPQQPKVELPRIVMICRGLTYAAPKEGKKKSKSKPTIQWWIELTGDRETWNEQCKRITTADAFYDPKNMPFCRPGAIYSFETPKPGTIRPHTAKFVEFLDEDFVERWQIDYDSFKAEVNLKKQEASESGRDLPWERLEPFRAAFIRANSFQRSAILLQVLRKVQG